MGRRHRRALGLAAMLPTVLRLTNRDILVPIMGTMLEWLMRLIARNVLTAYAARHPETAVSLERWQRLVRTAKWVSMDDVRRAVPRAKVLNRERVRFAVAGGDYRLIAAFDFRRQIVFVKFLGTHAEYDPIDALTVAMY
jgi:mRNA interferase HigB